MKSASLHEIKKELQTVETSALLELALRMARYRKENKELLTYLLFEAQDEPGYVESIKRDIDEQFEAVPKANLYFVRKGLRRILRLINRQIRYSGVKQSELEIRLHYCMRLKESGIPMDAGTAISNLYQQQIKKIKSVLSKLPEDLQFDYQQSMTNLLI